VQTLRKLTVEVFMAAWVIDAAGGTRLCSQYT
jgi:hypothetical protein